MMYQKKSEDFYLKMFYVILMDLQAVLGNTSWEQEGGNISGQH